MIVAKASSSVPCRAAGLKTTSCLCALVCKEEEGGEEEAKDGGEEDEEEDERRAGRRSRILRKSSIGVMTL